MGHISAADGSLTIDNDATRIREDLQKIADLAVARGVMPPGTRADRLALTPSQSRVGWLFVETDTGYIFRRVPSGWEPVLGETEHSPIGVNIEGIELSPSVELPRGPIIKTGQVTDSGSIAFGNQYMAAVAFATPFPTALLTVQLTQVEQDGAGSAERIALDDANATGFRVFYPGVLETVKRSFLWMAVGY